MPLVRLSSLEQTFPNASKICGWAVLRHRAQNEFTGDIKRNWKGRDWRAGTIGRRRRIVLNHTHPPLPVLSAERSSLTARSQLQMLSLKRRISCRPRHGRIRGRFTPTRKRIPVRPAKLGDQIPNRRTATLQCLYQPIQAVFWELSLVRNGALNRRAQDADRTSSGRA
jgi:hypothetical protein